MKALIVGLFSLLLGACQLTTPTVTEQLAPADSGLTQPEQNTEVAANSQTSDDSLSKETEVVAKVEAPLPVVYDDVWLRIEDQLAIPLPENNKRLQAQLNWFLKHPDYMRRVSVRADPYLFFIVEEIERRNMPLELALLPIVESAFQPFAYSHGRAAGIWQIIPGTGTRFGLEQNWWYDGRRDVYAATHAALDYLEYLNKYFDGDWLHALAAYNSGEGRVRRAIRANEKAGKATDFWSLNLPRETRAYVPKLLALSQMLQQRDDYKLNIPAIANKPYFEKVATYSQIDLALAAELAGIKLDELHKLNPGFNRWATAPDGPHYLLVPTKTVPNFEIALASLSKQERMQWARYKVKSGDSLSVIAKRYNTTSKQIRELNQLSNNTIRIGQHLLVPVSSRKQSAYTLSQSQRLVSQQNKPRGDIKLNYTVKSGDSFWSIAQAYKVSHRNVAKWNSMAPTDTLKPGKKLVIWQKSKASKNHIQTVTYQVRNGDSLSRIAQKFKVSITDLLKWNDLNKNHYLQPGQKLKLYINVAEVSA
ncbi:LysM peptidoglycan-binding domain-containing protein [Agarivorans sp. 1_MG-2023]|uniref:lytic transglycosylase n=1 Tax=Agarivorans sp. 1_MG-2023 TaxID=3062634 RepID=UPI0026E1835D|nr:LysM peptidoglycan-binding domain-containing protein [Agarivorans sp. 1_MG-2023]MDO6762762.1 LysM peptidoglycan-binding domain-containing protein [Agarivorans sp. 1_MG-2023]